MYREHRCLYYWQRILEHGGPYDHDDCQSYCALKNCDIFHFDCQKCENYIEDIDNIHMVYKREFKKEYQKDKEDYHYQQIEKEKFEKGKD